MINELKGFHVTCAQAEGLLCEEGGGSKNVKYCGYCSTHVKRIVSFFYDNFYYLLLLFQLLFCIFAILFVYFSIFFVCFFYSFPKKFKNQRKKNKENKYPFFFAHF